MNSQRKRTRRWSRVPRPHRAKLAPGYALGLVALCAVAGCLPIRMPMPKASGSEEPQDVVPPGVTPQVSVSTFTPTPSLTPVPSATALPTVTPTATPTPTRPPLGN